MQCIELIEFQHGVNKEITKEVFYIFILVLSLGDPRYSFFIAV